MPDSFRILGQAKITRFNAATRRAEEGWQIDYADNATGVHSQVFVPAARYPAAVQAVIEAELAQIREVHSLSSDYGA